MAAVNEASSVDTDADASVRSTATTAADGHTQRQAADPSTETGGSGLVADELTSLATVATVDQSIETS